MSAQSTELPRQVRRGALWSGGSNVLMRVANIAITAVVVRFVSPREFGVFAIALTVHAVVSNIGELGVGSSLVRADMHPDRVAPTITSISVVTSLVLATAMFWLAHPLATALGTGDAAPALRVMALAVALVGVFVVPSAQLTRDFRQDVQFGANAAGFVIGNGVLIALAVGGGGALAFAWSRVLGQLVSGLVMTAFAAKRYRPGWDPAVVRPLLRFGLPLAGANFVNYMLLNADYALVGRQLGPVLLGTYMLAFNVASWSSGLMSAMVNGVGMAAFSRLRDDVDLLFDAIVNGLRVLAAIAFPIAGLTLVLAGPLVRSVYGARWAHASTPLAVLAAYGAISICCLSLANALVAVGRTRLLFGVQLAWLGTLVPAMVVGIHIDGIAGAAAAHLVVIAVVVAPVYFVLLRRLFGRRVRRLWEPLRAPLVATCLAALAAELGSRWVGPQPAKLLLGGSLGVLVYVIGMAPALTRFPGGFGRLDGVVARVAGAVRRVGFAPVREAAGQG